MSTAMMSAPSSASRIACERPWPRAAPVMKATLPSSFPATYQAPFTSVTAMDALSAVMGAMTPETADKAGRDSAAGAEAGQGALVAGRVGRAAVGRHGRGHRRTPADRHGHGRGRA